MLIRETRRTLQASLEVTGQALNRLDPWEAWRTFKAFLHVEIEDGYDAASVQLLPSDPDPDLADEASLLLVRQFTEREPDEGEDQLLGRVVLELKYSAAYFRAFASVEIWTLDFPTLEEWASVVEGTACFQEAMARQPLFTEVYYDEGAGDSE